MQCFYYWVLEPAAGRIIDKDDRCAAFQVTVKFMGHDYKVALFSDTNGRAEFVRLTMPGFEHESIPDDLLPFIQSIGEHMLTTLRLGYDGNARFFNFHFWGFKPEGKAPTTDMAIELHRQPKLQAELLQNLFTNSLNHREEFRLFNNGTNEGIPAQYRFLSLYKLLEMKFRKQGRWCLKFPNFVATFKPRFDEKHLLGDPVSLIHGLRDKCAHIRTGKKRELLGVSELNHKELITVLKVLPIMAEMGAKILGDLTDHRVAIQPIDKDARWAKEVENHRASPEPTKESS